MKQMIRTAAMSVLRKTWRTLPAPLRSSALRIMGLTAPRPHSNAKAASPVIIAGLLTHPTGIGAAARACYDALKAAGIEVYGIDLGKEVMAGSVSVPFEFRDGRACRDGGTIMLHIPPNLTPFAMQKLGRRMLQRKRVVSHWFWELQKAPEAWKRALPFANEIWVNSHFVAEAMADLAPEKPLNIVPYPMAAEAYPESSRQPGAPFTVLTVFNTRSNFERKNPCAAIHAFRMAFGDDPTVKLVLKHAQSESWPPAIPMLEEAARGASNITLIGEDYTSEQMDGLFESADAILSLHRAEGLGLVLAEAMMRGLPVVATDWSATCEFLSAETGMPVDYTLVPVQDPQEVYVGLDTVWAEADIAKAAAALQELRDNPAKARGLGQAARTAARERFDPARYADFVRTYLSA